MSLLGATTITVTRPGAGVYTDGFWVDGPETTLTVEASIQPLSGRELANLNEGQRAREPIKLYTETELRPVDDVAETKGDRFRYAGRDYEVQSVGPWTGFQPAHYKCLALLVEQPAEGEG